MLSIRVRRKDASAEQNEEMSVGWLGDRLMEARCPLTKSRSVRLINCAGFESLSHVPDESHGDILVDQVGEGRRDELEQERGRVR